MARPGWSHSAKLLGRFAKLPGRHSGRTHAIYFDGKGSGGGSSEVDADATACSNAAIWWLGTECCISSI